MSGEQPRGRLFFLNERHELIPEGRGGGGGQSKLGEIDWNERASVLASSLQAAKQTVERSTDPSRDHRYFLVAKPRAVPKRSDAAGKPRKYDEETKFAGKDSMALRRLGLDLIAVVDDGRALVHARAFEFERLLRTAAQLEVGGAREQARWVRFDRFDPVEWELRVDRDWLGQLDLEEVVEVDVQLHALLSASEVRDVRWMIVKMLSADQGERFLFAERDTLERSWFRLRARRGTIESIAKSFSSVRSLHPPLRSELSVASSKPKPKTGRVAPRAHGASTEPTSIDALPVVAVVDTGVPHGHSQLEAYRVGTQRHEFAEDRYYGGHGSRVASRVVFGDVSSTQAQNRELSPGCRFYDVMVARCSQKIEDKVVVSTMRSVVGQRDDVRVFNLSFGEQRSLEAYSEICRREMLANVAELDNFAFANDVLVVVAAGNSTPGAQPNQPYPRHIDDPAWGLGAWPSSFNSLTVGSTIGEPHPEGIVQHLGAPSPFTRIGPGIAGAPLPELGAHGGNLNDRWQKGGDLGVWACNEEGFWEDYVGTSLAAPLVAREAAMLLHRLRDNCPIGARPFAVTAKALLLWSATQEEFPRDIEKLAKRTTGWGRIRPDVCESPNPRSAVFLWQGVLEAEKRALAVNLPIPSTWLRLASAPKLRLVCCWDPPVSDAAHETWATRKLSVQLRPGPGGAALHPSGRNCGTLPVIDRTYDLAQLIPEPPASGSHVPGCELDLSYTLEASYQAAMNFDPRQRVAFVAELFDEDESSESPLGYVQALPIASSFDRLSVAGIGMPIPVPIRR